MKKGKKLNCDPAVKAYMPDHRKCNKARNPYNFKGAKNNYLLNLENSNLDPNREYQLCHNAAQKIKNQTHLAN